MLSKFIDSLNNASSSSELALYDLANKLVRQDYGKTANAAAVLHVTDTAVEIDTTKAQIPLTYKRAMPFLVTENESVSGGIGGTRCW